MTATQRPLIELDGFRLSGHVHRVRLMLSLLGLPFREHEIDLPKGEHKQPEFLARNVFGQVPVLRDGDLQLADSNAICVYLAGTYDASRRWWPTEPLAQAQVQRWLSAAAGPLAFGPSIVRAARLFKRPLEASPTAVAERLFKTMEAHLEGRDWLALDHATLADVAMYTYTAHAPEGGLWLDDYPRIRAWLARVEALPGSVGMTRSPLPERAAA